MIESNPNKLTGETVLEKLKYYLVEAENQLTKLIQNKKDRFVYRELETIRDDLKWCIDQLANKVSFKNED